MTLIVSVIVQDGIVLAGDSFTTLTTQAPQETPEPRPIKAFPHAQKIVPFYGRFGIGGWGEASINRKSVALRIRELEHELKVKGVDFSTVDEVAETIKENILPLKFENDLSEEKAFGFYVVGYAGRTPKVLKYHHDEDSGSTDTREVDFGVYAEGYTEIANCIDVTYGDGEYPPFGLFSLQNAIDYALFVIRTTIEFQEFSSAVSTVGGAIDVAVVTRLEGFRWIQRQPTSPVLQRFTDVS